MNIKFLGAIGTVTGSSYLLETNNHKILVDFGLYQEENADNEEMAFEPESIDIVLLTHAHIDHVGRIPYLFKKGFEVYAIDDERRKLIKVVTPEDIFELEKSLRLGEGYMNLYCNKEHQECRM